MAFSAEPVLTPTAIGEITVHLHSPDPTTIDESRARYTVQVRYSDGSTRVVSGNLVPHLSQAQINGLLGFMDSMRVQAIAQILP
jgi:hypothetical protein